MEQKIFDINRSGPRVTLPKYRIFGTRGREINGENVTFYSRLCKQYPELQKYTAKEIQQFITSFNTDTVIDVLLHTREGVQLPANAGHFVVGTIKDSNLYKLDNKKLLVEHKIAAKYTNDDTNGYRPWLYYTVFATPVQVKGGTMWSFRAHQKLIKKVYAEYKKNWRMYYIIGKPQYVSMVLRDKRKPKQDG